MRRFVAGILLSTLWLAPSITLADLEAPVPVSPGSPKASRQIVATCPTFSWGGVDDAGGYELVVYEVAESGELKTAVKVALPRGATTWTPSAADCLDFGVRYAWAVRAVRSRTLESWSKALLFETPGTPSEDELHRALDVLERYRESLGSVEAAAIQTAPKAGDRRRGWPSDKGTTPPKTGSAIRRSDPLTSSTLGVDRSPPTVTTPTNPALDIDGDFELAGFVFMGGTPFIHTQGKDVQKANTAVGLNALTHVTIESQIGLYGYSNTAMGYRALEYMTTGTHNTAVGAEALRATTGNTDNVAVGSLALTDSQANFNTAVGARALRHNSSGTGNTAIGSGAMFYNVGGHSNTAMGTDSLVNNTSGSGNVASGYFAMISNSTGYLNTASGYMALPTNDTGYGNTSLGSMSMRYNETGSRNTAVGSKALWSNTYGHLNSAVGYGALYSNTSGHSNTAIGPDALNANDVGQRNTAIGFKALWSNTEGSENTAIGYRAGYFWTTGHYNIALGYGVEGNAGESGTIRIGGSNAQSRTFIEGIQAATSDDLVDGFDTQVCIDQFDQLGPCPVAPSSRRFKEAIRTMGDTAEQLATLRPVTFRYRPGLYQNSERIQFGLIAEEVAEVFPTLVRYDEDGKPYTVRYEMLTPLLLNEFQRQEKELRDLRQEISRIKRQKRLR